VHPENLTIRAQVRIAARTPHTTTTGNQGIANVFLPYERRIAAYADGRNCSTKLVAHDERWLATWAVVFKRLEFAPA